MNLGKAIVGLKSIFCPLALTATLTLIILTTAHAEASSIESQLEQTAEKLARIPVSTYAQDARMGKVMVETARLFLGIPYVPGTLEKDEESLVVKLDGYDCATFVDTVLALSRSRLLSREKSAFPATFIEDFATFATKMAG